jgi:hypothetical protein
MMFIPVGSMEDTLGIIIRMTRNIRRRWPSIVSEPYEMSCPRGKMLISDLAIRNKTLFQVHGQERVVFDNKLPFDLVIGDGRSFDV